MIEERVETETEDGASNKFGLRRMLTEKQVLDLIPISRTTLFRLIRVGRFPKGTYISANRRLWFLDQVRAWQDAINTIDQFNPSRGRGKGRRPRVSPGPS